MTNDLQDLLFDVKKNQLPDLAGEVIVLILELETKNSCEEGAMM